MKGRRLAAGAAFFLVFLGCRPKGAVIELGGYSFSYRGKTYKIESVTPNYMEGYNILSRREGENLVFKAIDKDQNAVIDQVIMGNFPLEEANRIYEAGIAEGERRGYIRTRTFAREYQYSDALNEYLVATYVLAVGEVYNRLTVVQKRPFHSESVTVDADADGHLDRIESGIGTLSTYQKVYQQVLEHGMGVNKIVRSNKRFLVVP